MLSCIFLCGHTAHSKQYSSGRKFPTPISSGPGSRQPRCASQETPGAGVLLGSKQLAGWEWNKDESACRTEWGNRPGWNTAPLRQYKHSGKCNFKLSLHKTKWPEKFNRLFWFSRQKWGWRKDNQKKYFFFGNKWCSSPARISLGVLFYMHASPQSVFVLQKLHCLLNTLL